MLGAPSSDALVSSVPPFDFQTQLSGDGHYLFIRSDGLLAPGTDYRVRVHGNWAAPPAAGGFDNTLRFRTAPPEHGGKLPLSVGSRRVGALELSRLALPLPSLLPSVNQIGFDSYDLIAGTLAKGGGHVLLWVIAARTGKNGVPQADPKGNFAFPLSGTYRGDEVLLNASQVNLQFSFGPVPIRSLDFRGELGSDGRFAPGASVYGQVSCASVPNYSVYLYVAGVCNPGDTLASYGTFLSDGYDKHGSANLKPKGVRVGDVTLQAPSAVADGEAVAQLRLDKGTRYRAGKHMASILLVDADTGEPVSLDYRALTAPVTDAKGNISEVHLRIPVGTLLPPHLRAYVIGDVYPLAVGDLAG
jgi:hypothetical protein